MKGLTALFGFGVVGVVFSFVMAVSVAVKESRVASEAKAAQTNSPVAVPAY